MLIWKNRETSQWSEVFLCKFLSESEDYRMFCFSFFSTATRCIPENDAEDSNTSKVNYLNTSFYWPFKVHLHVMFYLIYANILTRIWFNF